jgi:hypothetical protein
LGKGAGGENVRGKKEDVRCKREDVMLLGKRM